VDQYMHNEVSPPGLINKAFLAQKLIWWV